MLAVVNYRDCAVWMSRAKMAEMLSGWPGAIHSLPPSSTLSTLCLLLFPFLLASSASEGRKPKLIGQWRMMQKVWPIADVSDTVCLCVCEGGRGGSYRGGGGRLWNDYEFNYNSVGFTRNARSKVDNLYVFV